MISINEKANEYNASVYIYHLTLGSRYKNPKRKPNTKRHSGFGMKKKLEETKGVESKSGIIGTDISIKQLILRRPEISFETPSPNSF